MIKGGASMSGPADLPGATVAKKPVVVVVFNQKGGIGKTTTSVNLAVCLAALGHSVVLIDLDAQSNATTSVGLATAPATGVYQVLTGVVTVAEALRETPYANLRVIAGSDDLSWADVEIAVKPEPNYVLERALAGVPDDVEVVVVDCPPAFGILSVNATVAADVVVLPVVPAPLALDGLHKAWWNIQKIRTHYNRDLNSMGILLTKTEYDDTSRRLTEAIAASFGPRVLPAMVPRDNKVVEAAERDLPLMVFDPDSPAARAYLLVAELVLTRLIPGSLGHHRAALSVSARDRAVAVLRSWGPRRGEGPHSGPPQKTGRPVRETQPMAVGAPPNSAWASSVPDEAEGEKAAFTLPKAGIGWKLGVALLLMVLGGIIGFALGSRWPGML
jgi:chromosome partitioning protein